MILCDIIDGKPLVYIITNGIGIYKLNNKIMRLDIYLNTNIDIILTTTLDKITLSVTHETKFPKWFIDYVIKNRTKIISSEMLQVTFDKDVLIIDNVTIETNDPFKTFIDYINVKFIESKL